MHIENPKRDTLCAIYTNALVDIQLTGCFTRHYQKTLLKSFVILDKDGKEDEDVLKIIRSEWFHHFLMSALDSIAWGHSLVQPGDTLKGYDYQ